MRRFYHEEELDAKRRDEAFAPHRSTMARDDWQGKGIGAALMQAAIDLAAKWLNLFRLELGVYPDNEPAIKLYKKFGFQVEGTQGGYAFRDGQYVDTLMMARVRLPK